VSGFQLDRTLQQEILGLGFMALGVITLLGLLSITHGTLSDWWSDLLRRLFGWGAWIVAGAVIGAGAVLVVQNLRGPWTIPWERVVAFELVLAAGLALFHLAVARTAPLTVAEAGGGGGLLGWAISQLLVDTLGPPLATLLLFLVSFLSLIVGLKIPLGRELQRLVEQVNQRIEAIGTAAEVPTPSPPPTPTEAVVEAPPKRRKQPSKPKPASAPQPATSARPKSPRPTPASRVLPPLDLLDPASPQRFKEEELRERVRIIEETLAAFGVPARVVSVNQGPTITQFGVEPGYVERAGRRRKVRVNEITRLANDLALALAAAPVRIEAPVPGRSVVGIEVPNTEISVVSLREIMESTAFKNARKRSRLVLALGRDVSGDAVVADLTKMPHLLIAGATGSGKSVCINAIIAALLFQNTPKELRLILIDPKRVELTGYNGIPHLLAPVVVELDEVVGALRWAQQEMDRRYQTFAATGVRNIGAYNRKVAQRSGEEPMPYIVLIIDELADLMMVSPEEVERSICRLAQLARATGIHLVIATQRPSVDVITGLIKANFPARISFAVTSSIDSRVILDTVGAEKLLGRGDMLFLPPDASAPHRLQGSYISDRELSKLVAFWRGTGWPVVERATAAPWADLVEAMEEETDELLDEAIQLVRQYERVSTSFLQRRLHIGYPRAARLIDELEARGIIGPDEGGGQGRRVLLDEEPGEEDGVEEEETFHSEADLDSDRVSESSDE